MRKFIVIVFAAVVAGILFFMIGCSVYDNLPDYIKDDNIPKGYTDTDGHSYAGKDLDEYFWYQYDNKQEYFEKSEEYTLVDESNITELKNAVQSYEEWGEASFSNEISCGDYYIIIYHDSDGNVINEHGNNNVMLYFYDTDSNKLHYFYYVI